MDLFGKKSAKRVAELETQLKDAQAKLKELGYEEYAEAKAALDHLNADIAENNSKVAQVKAH